MKIYTHSVFAWDTCKLESCETRDYEGPVTQLKSSSKQSQQTQQTTVNESRNLNIQDVEGITLGEAGGDVTIVSTDQNAFDRASDLAERSVSVGEALGRDALSVAFDLSKETARAVNESTNQALKFGDRAFGTVEKALGQVTGAYQDSAAYQSKALTAVQDTNENALDAVGGFFSEAFAGIRGFVADVTERSQNTLSSTVTSLNTIARENSKSTDERVAEISGTAIKYVVIGVGVLGVAVAIFAFKKG